MVIAITIVTRETAGVEIKQKMKKRHQKEMPFFMLIDQGFHK
jgi:hypothetical protein